MIEPTLTYYRENVRSMTVDELGAWYREALDLALPDFKLQAVHRAVARTEPPRPEVDMRGAHMRTSDTSRRELVRGGIGEWLVRRMNELGVSNIELGETIGVTPSSIAAYRCERVAIPRSRWLAVADALGATYADVEDRCRLSHPTAY